MAVICFNQTGKNKCFKEIMTIKTLGTPAAMLITLIFSLPLPEDNEICLISFQQQQPPDV